MPYIFVNLLDHPVISELHPPDKTSLRHGIMLGMKVLEVGPGSARYTTTTLATGDNLENEMKFNWSKDCHEI